MMTEAKAGFRAFNEGPAGHREVDFAELRRRLARGDTWDDELWLWAGRGGRAGRV